MMMQHTTVFTEKIFHNHHFSYKIIQSRKFQYQLQKSQLENSIFQSNHLKSLDTKSSLSYQLAPVVETEAHTCALVSG